MYTVDEQVAASLRSAEPTLLHAVRGFVDAGNAGQVAAEHLTERFDTRRLVTFDVDELLDYRSRRPLMTFDAARWSDYDQPELVVDVVRDAENVPFLLLHGMEPDVRWEAWTRAMREIVERFAVPLTVGVHGIPMGVPHTRPLGVTAHGTRTELVADHLSWFGTVQVPASASALLEYRLGRWGHDAMGFAVHVPHYLAQASYPRAALVALEQVQRTTGLDLQADALEAAAVEATEQVEQQVADSPEIAAVVRALEQQHDNLARVLPRPDALVGQAGLPTAEELGAQFEEYLAQQPDEHPDE
ncbi:PAC2 family protein [Actinotalea sp.]|uniref:PAC2 family protein n=1 Tax=Actinotalea sp. TaxID=1872145 RepID=UPI002B9C4A8A|nr:PAC2 family protein [Actinotalea sp.]HRA49783.1 PAC2 family protein [Actinotalea sp.]